MPNINDVHPSEISLQPVSPASSSSGNILQVHPDQIQTPEQFQEDKYSTVGQQALTVAEGLGHGFLGPVATATEAGLSKLGVPGLSPEAQAARAEVNPVESYGSEAAGFGAGMFTGTGEAAAIGKLGELAASGVKGASAISKIAQTGIKTGAELAALQTGEEVSKAINQDPNQTLGSAAINVGLSGLLGGAGGVALGTVSPLFKTAANKIGISKLAADYMGESKFLQENPDMVHGATEELSSRMTEAENMRNVMSEAKPELIAKAVPEVTDSNLKKINAQLGDINSKVSTTLESASKSVKTKAAVPFLSEDLTTWQNTVNDPNATFADKFLATNKLKQNLESYAKWGLTEEGSAKAALGRSLSNYVRPLLEDTKVWGGAGDIQKITNEAVTQVIRANEDLLPKVTSKLMGDREIDPNKLQTFFNQVEKGKAGLKANAIRNYLDHTQKWADAINKVHLDNGIEAPLTAHLNPTPVLDRSLNTPTSPGRSLAQWANRKGADALAKAAGETASGTLGGIAGAIVGHPLVGAWVGEKVLAPTFSVLAKPFAEQAVNSEAMRSSIDYVINAIKGTNTLNESVGNFFKTGEILPKSLLPNADSRKKLERSLASLDSPQNAFQVGGNLGHYMPDHHVAVAAIAAQAKTYLDGLKPKPIASNPFDHEPPVDKAQQAKYERALDVAQQPLLVLKFAKEGRLLPQDIQTLQKIYPGLHNAMVSKLNEELIAHKAEGKSVPYAERINLSLLMGSTPLDSTMVPQNMQSIIRSSASQIQSLNQSKPQKAHKATNVELKQINKVNDLYATSLQAHEIAKRSQ